MAETILVLNAGSSSIKFSLFHERGAGLVPGVRGQVERIATQGAPHFVAREPDGRVAVERHWPEKSYLGHEGAVKVVVEFVRGALGGAALSAAAHRVVHGGALFTGPVRIDEEVLARPLLWFRR